MNAHVRSIYPNPAGGTPAARNGDNKERNLEDRRNRRRPSHMQGDLQ
jgi:hypothetical protein